MTGVQTCALPISLAASGGQRRDLGVNLALGLVKMAGVDNGKRRGIGPNIQSAPIGMVVPKGAQKTAMATTGQPESGELMETCQFSLTPVQ